MILTELLQTSNLPRLNNRVIKREFKLARNKTQRFVRVWIKKTRTKTMAVARRQYFLSHAYRDMQVSIQRNEDIFITAMITVLVLTFGAAATATNVVFLFFQTALDLSNISGASMAIIGLIATSVLTVLVSWFLAFLLNFMSLSIMDGATRKVNRSVRTTARKALRYTSRVAISWLALASVLTAPIALTAILGFLYVSFNGVSMDALMVGFQAGIIAGLSWIIFALMNYSLVPYVALFEPSIAIRDALARSQQLVRSKGRLFILAGYVALSAIFAAIYTIANFLDHSIGTNKWLLIFMASIAVVTIANGVMVTFYRKRKLARK
ncbi:MAG: hypothetical protein JWL85_893 [Candidatus Saccharibacteria bacterium]|nr:hypothetical protein [Candidatus Saccharibacteria bacterium]